MHTTRAITLLLGWHLLIGLDAVADLCREDFVACVERTGFPPKCQSEYQSCLSDAHAAEKAPTQAQSIRYVVSQRGQTTVSVIVSNGSGEIGLTRSVEIELECNSARKINHVFSMTDRIAGGERNRIGGLAELCTKNDGGIARVVAANFISSGSSADTIEIKSPNQTPNQSRPLDKMFTIEIVAGIRDVSPFSFQVGEKSRQIILVNLTKSEVSSREILGTTDIGFTELPPESIEFSAQFKSGQRPDTNKVSAAGQVGTGVGFGLAPTINYKFVFTFEEDSLIAIDGCHDGYPSYQIFVDGTELYNFEQGMIGELIGECDTVVNFEIK